MHRNRLVNPPYNSASSAAPLPIADVNAMVISVAGTRKFT